MPAPYPTRSSRGTICFFGKGACHQCHVGSRFTDNTFHNIVIGWNAATRTFADDGRFEVTKLDADRGAFKTPTLRGVVEYYNRGGNANPYMDLKMPRAPLGLSEAEIDALVAMLESLTGEGYADTAPTSFPQ